MAKIVMVYFLRRVRASPRIPNENKAIVDGLGTVLAVMLIATTPVTTAPKFICG